MVRPLVLLTGVTGYIGGRLLHRLEEDGRPVRCLVRSRARMAGRERPGTEIVEGDCLDAASLDRALAGVHTAFYLVHSMSARADFAAVD